MANNSQRMSGGAVTRENCYFGAFNRHMCRLNREYIRGSARIMASKKGEARIEFFGAFHIGILTTM